jgi:uncharacterized protein YegL
MIRDARPDAPAAADRTEQLGDRPLDRPGRTLSRRPLHFFFVLDCSGSMAADGKIQALNNAIRETLPHLADVARQNPDSALLVRALAFSTGCRWHIAEPTPADDLQWPDLEADGFTDLGEALQELANQLKVPPMEERAYPPAIVLVSDGQPTDDFHAGLRSLLAEPWGARAIRMAVAIGRDVDHGVLQEFIGRPDLAPGTANNPEQLARLIRWTSTVASRASSDVVTPTRRHGLVPRLDVHSSTDDLVF